MNTLVKLEEIALFSLSIYLFSLLGFDWWLFIALLFVPDFSMLGYLAGNKAGAWLYNFFHHTGLTVAVYLIGIYLGNETVQLAGVILFAHSRFDRIFGYGFKYEKGFKFTHLGEIGKK